MTLEELFKKAGFSEKGGEVYQALLKLGSSIVSDVAKKAGINRSTTYVILDALSKRGLVSITERRGVKVYNPISPEQLVRYLKNTANQYNELAQVAEELLPKLKFENIKEEAVPKIQIFEGKEGIKTVMSEFKKSTKFQVISQDLNIYGNKIVFISPLNTFALVIESKDFAEVLKKISN
jgi:sugar-specific transcriptional regulator TrmB